MKLYYLVGLVLTLALASAQPTAARTDTIVRNLNLPHVAGELLIKYNDDLSLTQQKTDLSKLGGEIKHRFRSSGAIQAYFPDTTEGPEFYDLAMRIANQPNVEYVEANSLLRIVEMPNDSNFDDLYGMHNTGQTGGTADADIDAPEAWDETTGSRDVLVAVIDTGVNYAHTDLAPNYWTNPGETGTDGDGNDMQTNGIDDDGNGYVDDWRGWDFVNEDNDPMDDNSSMHGSHCAGTIGGAGNNDFGVVGVAWEVSIVGVKFLSASGGGSLANAVKAVEYATVIDVDIQSNSWGGGGFSQVLSDAITEAEANDILFVAAAGNSADDTDANPHYPSSYSQDNVLSVAATDHSDELASFSNYGATNVDVAAPGVNILSCYEGNSFQELSGTSMATPHVSGLAALVKSKYADATYSQMKSRIMNGVDRIAGLRGNMITGGRINAANALEDDDVAPGMVTGINFSSAQIDSVEIAWNPTGDDGEDGMASTYEVRFSPEPIENETQWRKAGVPKTQHSGTSSNPSARLSGFPFNFTGYAVVRAVDNVGNLGPMSDSMPFAVAEVEVLFTHDAESLDGIMAEAPWSLEIVEGSNGNAFSDSPGSVYSNDSNFAITFDEMDFGTETVKLVYRSQTDIERGYDFGFVEISTDGGANWNEIEKLTGSKTWQTRMVDLSSYLVGNTSFQIRYRLQTDYVVEADGWFIDDVQILTESR